jgi:hypothetical protein
VNVKSTIDSGEDLFESEGRVVRSIVASAGEIIKSRQSPVVSLDAFFVDTRKYLAAAILLPLRICIFRMLRFRIGFQAKSLCLAYDFVSRGFS